MEFNYKHNALRVLFINLINLLIVLIYYSSLTLILNLYIILLLHFHGTRDIGDQWAISDSILKFGLLY